MPIPKGYRPIGQPSTSSFELVKQAAKARKLYGDSFQVHKNRAGLFQMYWKKAERK